MRKILLSTILLVGINSSLIADNAPTQEVEVKTSPVFTFDGISSGMNFKQSIAQKITPNEDGTYTVMSGSTTGRQKMLYGASPSGDDIQYKSDIAGKKATVNVYFTKKSEMVFGIRSIWKGMNYAKGGGAPEFRKAIIAGLSKKYGEPKKLSKEEVKKRGMVLYNAYEWTPNNNTVIRFSDASGANMSMMIMLTYVDKKLEALNHKEEISAIKTNAL